jgi:hypothetical protein
VEESLPAGRVIDETNYFRLGDYREVALEYAHVGSNSLGIFPPLPKRPRSFETG